MKNQLTTAFFLIMTFSASVFSAEDVFLNISWKDFLKRNDMVWQKMPVDYGSAPFIGSGNAGLYLFQTDGNRLKFEVNRMDYYDIREANGAFPASKERIAGGYFELRYDSAAVEGKMRLNLWDAEVTGKITTVLSEFNLRTFAAEDDVFVIELTSDDDLNNLSFSYIPREAKSNSPPKNYQAYPKPVNKKTQNINVVIQNLPKHKKYHTNKEAQYVIAWQELKTTHSRRIYASVKLSNGDRSAEASAVQAIKNALSSSVKEVEKKHRAWWHEYYRRSFISLPSSKHESFYWIQMYKLASTSREDSAIIDLYGPWWKPDAVWNWYTWNLNVQLSYSPLYKANHNDIASSLINQLWHKRETLQKNTAYNTNLFGKESFGLARGSDAELNSPLKTQGQEISNLAYTLSYVWQQYSNTMDDNLLKEKIFPLMKGHFNLYASYWRLDEKGTIHFDKTRSPETGVFNDSSYTLASVKWLAKKIIWTNEHLALQDPVAEQAKYLLNNVVNYPQNNQKGILLGQYSPLKKSHRHWSHLFLIYPYLEYTYDDKEQAQIIDKSLDYWQKMGLEKTGFGELGYGAMQIMKGDGDNWLKQLNWTLDANQMPGNTFWYHYGHSPTIETPLFAARTMQDMLLMAYNGIIRVFPGAPKDKDWQDISFHNFIINDGFEVSAKRSQGQTEFIRIKSLAGQPLRVKTDLKGKVKTHGNRLFNIIEHENDVIEIDLKKDEWLVLYSSDKLPKLTITPSKKIGGDNYWGYPKGYKVNPTNIVSLNKPAKQSSTLFNATADKANDGNLNGILKLGSVSHTDIDEHSWWEVDLEQEYNLDMLRLYNRQDCCGDRSQDFWVLVSDKPFHSTDLAKSIEQVGPQGAIHYDNYPTEPYTEIKINKRARYVRVQLNMSDFLNLAEVSIIKLDD